MPNGSTALHEVVQDAEPDRPGLLGVELGAPHRTAFGRRRHRAAVVADCRGVIAHLGRVGVDEVNPRGTGEIGQEGGGSSRHRLELVPLHLRVFDTGRQQPDHAGQDPEARFGRVLVGPLVEQLESDADPEEGHATVDGRCGGTVQTGRAEGLGAPTERPHPGKDDSVGVGSLIGVVDQAGVGAQMLEGLLGRPEVADAVVEDGDHRRGGLSAATDTPGRLTGDHDPSAFTAGPSWRGYPTLRRGRRPAGPGPPL